MCHGDPGGGAGVPQVVLVDLPMSGPEHQTSTVQSEVHCGQRAVHTDRLQAGGAHGHETQTEAGGANTKAADLQVRETFQLSVSSRSAFSAFGLLCFFLLNYNKISICEAHFKIFSILMSLEEG